MRDNQYSNSYKRPRRHGKKHGRNPLVLMTPICLLLAGMILFAIFASSPPIKKSPDVSSAETETGSEPSESSIPDLIFDSSGEPASTNPPASVSKAAPSKASSSRNFLSSESVSSRQASSQKPDSGIDLSRKPPASESDQWYLKLVNGNYPLDRNYAPVLVNIKSSYVIQDDGRQFSAQAYDALLGMFEAAEKDGVSLKSKSSYRSYSTQSAIYENKVARVKEANARLTDTEARTEAAKVVARPGTSEHALGLSCDINSVSDSFENTPAFAWLKTHAADYGFVLRYPKNKQDITKIVYEPWHYRYVTPEHARRMNALGMCLEEYIDYLRS